MKKPAVLLVIPYFLLTACAATSGKPTEYSTNRERIETFAKTLYQEKNVEKAFMEFVSHDYIQHNPGLTDGRDAAIKALTPMFADPYSKFEVKRIIVEGDLAVIHLHGKGNKDTLGGAVADIYRLEKGLIVEHWDVIQPIKASTINPHPYF